LPNTVGPEIEELGKLSRIRPSPREMQNVLVLGRLDMHQKGLDLLLNFLEQPGSGRGNVRITLMGDGAARDTIRERIARSPLLRGMISMRPWADSSRALLEHDVLLLPSRFEGVPLVMLEAMALGVPVVASDLPGTRPFLPESCLFAVADLYKAFAAVEALSAPDFHHEVVERNRTSFMRQASMQSFAAAVERLSHDLLKLTQDEPLEADSTSLVASG
jgi:glycosyltransferase involved in cell wall biosynthesis